MMLKKSSLITCLFLSACMVGPDYKEPIKQVAPHWRKQDSSVKEKPFHDAKWWDVFHDPILTSFIYQGYHNNLNAQIAGVRVLQARAQLAQVVGELYPQQQAMIGDYTHYRLGGNELGAILPQKFDTAALGFSASWEIDFWGKYRRAIQASDATFLASVAAYDNTVLTLISDIASTYIKIRTAQTQIQVTKANIEVQKIGLKIARSRFNAGQTSLVDVEQAKTELAETESRLPAYINELQRQEDALALLLGTVPNNIIELKQKSHGIPKAPFSVAVGIPRETLARRPDIFQARMEAVAQLAAIGQAKANLYPSLSLTGSFVFSSNNIGNNSLGEIFNWSNRNIAAGPTLNWPILNYGQITNAVRAQDASFQQSLLSYLNLVLKAQQEVQDHITGYIEAKAAERYLTLANQAAIKTLKLTLIRYKEGETDFTPVLNAEQQQLRIQTSLVNAQGDIPQAIVALYRSLGGGWQIRACNDIVPNAIKREMASRTNWGTLLQQQNHMPPNTPWQQFKQDYLPKW